MAKSAIRVRGSPRLPVCILLLTLALTSVSSGYAAEVEVVLGNDSPTYAEVARHIADDLSGRATVAVTTSDRLVRGARRSQSRLVITLGLTALRSDLDSERSAPTLAALLPRLSYEKAVGSAPRASPPRSLTAVFLDQPPGRQLNLVRLISPECTRIGVIASTAFDESVRLLEAAARERRLVILRETAASPSGLHQTLLRLLPETDAILALPDPLVFNRSTIHNILLTTYRAQKPLFGFSSSYADAGAIAAVYSTPEQIARQVSDVAIRFLAGSALPPPQYPRTFSISVNATVANSLGIAVDSEQSIALRLQSMEREP